jgi:hypothetical protein
MTSQRLAALQIADPPDRWAALGFAVDDDRLHLGEVELQLGLPGEGIVAWALDPRVAEIDGLPVMAKPPLSSAKAHPNGAIGLDHVVIATPDFDRTADALDHVGLPFRRIRDAGSFRQGFRRLGPAILEVVEATTAPPGPARFWGLVVVVSDLQALSSRLAEHLGQIKPAVQPGRHIATLRDSAGLTTKVAFMDPGS